MFESFITSSVMPRGVDGGRGGRLKERVLNLL